MADVNLREYVAKLGDWMQEGSADQVIWHARHILQYYPKNVDAYRYVGKALASLGHLEEASAVLRRALSVIPDDGKAHAVLSEIYERLDRPNEAIWHMERAYEQDSNQPEIIDQLQRLYREYRHVSNPHLHMTTAAAARQDIRSGAYDRAVNSLRSALNRAPQRTDLQLLLAQGLWRRGDLVDAAEVAMDVLRTYPDCLAANQIMAELWLREGRPSDAQGYLNRLESVDPYLALELVQPGKSDPNTFRLPELDFDRSTQMAMVGDKLDWLEGIDAGDAPPAAITDDRATSLDDWLQTEPEAAVTSAEPMEAVGDQEADWLSQLDSIEQNYNVSTAEFQVTTSPLTDDKVDVPGTSEETPAMEEEEVDLSIEWASDSIGEPDAAAEDDPFKWLLTPEDDFDADNPATIDTEDPLAWMRQADIDLPDTTELSPEMLQEASDAEEDSMGWLRDYSAEMIGEWEGAEASEDQETASEEAEPALDDLSFAGVDELLLEELPFPSDDLLSDDAGDEESFESDALPDEAAAAEVSPLPADIPQVDTPIELSEDEWVLDEALLEESLGIEALADSAAESPAPGEAFAPQDQDWTPADEASEYEGQAETAQGTERGNIMSDATTPEFDWTDDEAETSGETLSTGATGMLDWLSRSESASSDDEEAMAEAVGAEAFQPEDGSTGMTDTLSWMEGEDAAQDEAPDIEKAEADSTGSTGMLNWLSQNRPLPPTLPLQSRDIDEQAQASSAGDDEEWLANLEDEALELVDEESTGATGILDWLGKDGRPAEPGGEAASTGELENADEWLADIMAAEEEIPQEAAAPPITWEAQAETAEDEMAFEDLGWLNAESQPDAEITLDDLTMIEGIEPETAEALQAAGITSFQALADAGEDDLIAALRARGLSDTYESSRWAAQARFLAEGDIQGFYNFQDSLLEGDQGQMPAVEVAGVTETFSVDDEPDSGWLGEDESDESDEAAPEAAEWPATSMSLEDDEEEPAREPETDLDWLSEDESDESDEESPEAAEWPAASMSLEDDEEEPTLESEADLDWLSEDVPEETAEESSEAPEWLAASMSLEDDEEEPALEPEADLDWFGEDVPEEAAEESSEAPEWLTATAALQGTVDASEAEGWLAEELAASTPESEDVPESVEVMLLEEGEEEAVPDWMIEAQQPEPLGDAEFDPLAVMDAAEEPLESAPADSEAAYEERELGELADDGGPTIFGDEGELEAESEEADVWNLEAYAGLSDEDMLAEPVEAEAEQDDYFTAFEDTPEAAEIAPAPNAPDWLNAMVPGLDIDYEAPEDEPLETTFETFDEGELEPTMPEDFGWVNEIVEEETRPEPAVEGMQERAPRFVFSRPPVWLRRLLERGPEQPSENDDDLPAWLR